MSAANGHARSNASAIRVGETVTVIGVAIDIGLPYYDLYIENGAGETLGAVRVTYDGQGGITDNPGNPFDVVSVQGERRQAVFVLRGRAPGVVQVRIAATGEVHYGYPGSATWSGGDSDPITLTVTE